MIKYWVSRTTAAKSSILSDSAVAAFEIVKQLVPDNSPELYSLVARSPTGQGVVIRLDRPAADLPTLLAQLQQIKSDIEAAVSAGKNIFFVTISADDLPEF